MANVNSSSVKKLLFSMGVSSKLSDVKRFVTVWTILIFSDLCIKNDTCLTLLLFLMTNATTKYYIDRGIVRNDTIWDKLVFAKVQASLGGRCRVVVCGSAPLEPKILDFMRCASGAVVRAWLCLPIQKIKQSSRDVVKMSFIFSI